MSIFGAIGGLLGGLLGNSAANKRQTQMLQWQERMDNTKIQRLQKDAKKAGVHPLAAMGTSLTSPSPVEVGGRPDFSDMGQNVGRALDATMSADQKANDYTRAIQNLTLDRMNLENDVIRTQLVNSAAATVRQPSSPPTFIGRDSREAPSPVADLKPEKQDTYTLFGKTFKQNPDFSAAERIQNVFGEPVEWPYSVVKILAELAEHGVHPALANRYNSYRGSMGRRRRPSSGW